MHSVQVCHSAAAVRTAAAGRRTALVPTMGGLHDGHLALVRHAREIAPCVAVSIYVNPLQFGENEDYNTYPRRLQQDTAALHALADIVYAPTDAEMYPQAQEVGIALPPLADTLCGASRPGHFQGMAVVVCKLLNQCRPNVVVFGRKDYQQAMLVRLMCAQLDMGVEVALHPTVREADNLAMSSRNEYLTPQERERAPQLYAALLQAAQQVQAGQMTLAQICAQAQQQLTAANFACEYVVARNAATLAELDATPAQQDIVLLAAARLGRTRLIDNITVTAGGELL